MSDVRVLHPTVAVALVHLTASSRELQAGLNIVTPGSPMVIGSKQVPMCDTHHSAHGWRTVNGHLRHELGECAALG